MSARILVPPASPVAVPARPAPARPEGDLVLFGAVLGLAAFGLVIVYSASAVYALSRFHTDTYFVLRQLLYLVSGLAALFLAQRVDYRSWARAARPLLIVSLILLVVVLIPGLGVRVGGAQRWFRLGPLSFQPSEVAKLALIVYLAAMLADKDERVEHFGAGFVAPLCVVGLVTGLTLLQPDLGTAILLGLAAVLVMFVAGTKLLYLATAALLTAPLAWYAIVGTPWRLQRLKAFIDPEAHRQGSGYQVYEALLTLGSGGPFGMGLGEGQQKLFYLPEAHTDFILPIIGQELGFVGVAAVLVLFGIILWRGVRIALRAPSRFGLFLALGCTGLIGLQAAINMAVVVGALPTKGITLPFVSYGGTSLVASLFMVGVILSVARGTERAAAEADPVFGDGAPSPAHRRFRSAAGWGTP